MNKLSNVKGRLSYIISTVRQENLYATYTTCDRTFWSKLAKENQADFIKSGTAGKCIEARELIIALPESYTKYVPQELLKEFVEFFKNRYGVECAAALHHNKSKTNYHIHLIFSERKTLAEPIRKVATRNMFYVESGHHCRTKKEILDESGNVRSGCKIIKKGEVYEQHLFEKKNPLFKQKNFLTEIKEAYTELINERINDENEKLKVFNKNSIYLPMKKIGKNNPNSENIKANNRAVLKWNEMAAFSAECGLPLTHIREVKQKEIVKPLKEISKADMPIGAMFEKIVTLAGKTLRNFMDIWLMMDKSRRPNPGEDLFYKILNDRRARPVNKKSRHRDAR